MSFYCGIAQRLGKGHLVRGFMALGGVSGADPAAARLVLDVLLKNGDDKLIDTFLNGCRGPALKYQMLQRFYRETGTEMPQGEWERLTEDVKDEASLWRLYGVVNAHSWAHAEDVLMRILAMDPEDSLYDGYAYGALARYAEEAGHFTQAANYLNKQATIRAQDGRVSKVDKANKFHATELFALADLEDETFSGLMLKARQEELDGKVDDAVTTYMQAVETAPKLPGPYKKIVQIYRERGDYTELTAFLKKMLHVKPLTTKDTLTWCYCAADIEAFEEAQAWLLQYSTTPAARLYFNYPSAMLAERRGELASAERFYSKLLRYDYKNIRRQVALVQIKRRKLPEAAALLEEHMLYNPFDQYARILLAYSRILNGGDDRAALRQYMGDIFSRDTEWSHWLMSYTVGDVTESDLLKMAETIGPKVSHYGQVCEAYFYTGLKALVDGDTAKAAESFKRTMAMGITVYIEHYWARDELKRLDGK